MSRDWGNWECRYWRSTFGQCKKASRTGRPLGSSFLPTCGIASMPLLILCRDSNPALQPGGFPQEDGSQHPIRFPTPWRSPPSLSVCLRMCVGVCVGLGGRVVREHVHVTVEVEQTHRKLKKRTHSVPFAERTRNLEPRLAIISGAQKN
jgi:hypothetical protein